MMPGRISDEHNVLLFMFVLGFAGSSLPEFFITVFLLKELMELYPGFFCILWVTF